MVTNNYLLQVAIDYIMLKGKPGYDMDLQMADALAEYIMYLGTMNNTLMKKI